MSSPSGLRVPSGTPQRRVFEGPGRTSDWQAWYWRRTCSEATPHEPPYPPSPSNPPSIPPKYCVFGGEVEFIWFADMFEGDGVRFFTSFRMTISIGGGGGGGGFGGGERGGRRGRPPYGIWRGI